MVLRISNLFLLPANAWTPFWSYKLKNSRCQFVIDLIDLTFLTPNFSHQWIFITDTVDAVYRPDEWFPEAMMDQLAEIASNLPVGVRPDHM
jgi:hypothetical protein